MACPLCLLTMQTASHMCLTFTNLKQECSNKHAEQCPLCTLALYYAGFCDIKNYDSSLELRRWCTRESYTQQTVSMCMHGSLGVGSLVRHLHLSNDLSQSSMSHAQASSLDILSGSQLVCVCWPTNGLPNQYRVCLPGAVLVR